MLILPLLILFWCKTPSKEVKITLFSWRQRLFSTRLEVYVKWYKMDFIKLAFISVCYWYALFSSSKIMHSPTSKFENGRNISVVKSLKNERILGLYLIRNSNLMSHCFADRCTTFCDIICHTHWLLGQFLWKRTPGLFHFVINLLEIKTIHSWNVHHALFVEIRSRVPGTRLDDIF